jgi:GAF domain-containing protein/HAMP domain-containing protein
MRASITLNPQPNNLSVGFSETTRRQDRFTVRMAVISALGMGVASLVLLITSFYEPYWQIFTIAAATATSLLFALFSIAATGEGLTVRRVILLVPVINITIILFSALVTNTALMLAVLNFLFGAVIVTGALDGRTRDSGITAIFITSIITLLMGVFSPFQQIRIPQIEIYLPVLLTAVVMGYIVLLVLEIVMANLRIKLLIGALAIAILPLMAVSVVNTRFIQDSLRVRSEQELKLVAEQTAAKVDQFFLNNLEALSSQSQLSIFPDYLSIAGEDRSNSRQELAVITGLSSFTTSEHRYLRSYALLDADGNNLYDTNGINIGRNEVMELFFVQPMTTGQPYASAITFDPETTTPYIVFSSPVRDQHQQIIGIIRAQYDAHVLQNLIIEQSNLIGNRSHPILLDENHLRVADSFSPHNQFLLLKPLESNLISRLLREKRLPNRSIHEMSTRDYALSSIVDNYTEEPFFSLEMHSDEPGHIETGVVVRLSSKPWYVVFVQEQTNLVSKLQTQSRISTLISTLVAAIVGLFASIIAGIFSTPIVRLQETAEKISSGNLEAAVQIETGDEIGKLARSFNYMTKQLRSSILELEDRVQARTTELSKQNEALMDRTRQLQTVSDVAREIVSNQELENLLTQLTTLISDRFGYYHVGVFLIDPQGDYAVLRASNSDGGRRMLALQHRLSVGQVGIVGFVAGSGEARIATDVGQDAVFFNNPYLPNTRSEMALPLKTNNQVIGVLDVQSTKPNAFSLEDIELFGILADQIAIAILNNRLYIDTLNALEESERIHRQYLYQEWGKDTNDRQTHGYQSTPHGLTRLVTANNPEIDYVLQSENLFVRNSKKSTEPAVLAVPIRLRGVTIGVIKLEDDSIIDRKWGLDEIKSIKAVADQVGLALENARLLEKTIRRAERERRVLEITGKIRSTNDPQEMINIAVKELQHTLNASRAQIIIQEDLASIEVPLENNQITSPSNGSGESRGNK